MSVSLFIYGHVRRRPYTIIVASSTILAALVGCDQRKLVGVLYRMSVSRGIGLAWMGEEWLMATSWMIELYVGE